MNPSKPVIRRRAPKSQRQRDGLIQFAYDVTSQNGEDGIIHKIFNEILPPLENGRNKRYCVDVGAWDGRHLSNTFALLDTTTSSIPWKGVLIEGDPEKFKDLKRLHGPNRNICVRAMVSCDPSSKDSLVSILQREATELPADFDFLCIDVDGSDYWLLHEIFENNYQPKVICIEANPTMPNDLVYIPPRDDIARHGCSLAALVELAEEYDYALVETTLYNAFFVPNDLYDRYFKELVPDNSIEALHEVTMGTELYQLYDGTLKLWGCKKLLWHRIAMDELKIQMLSSPKRSFPFAPNSSNNSAEEAIHNTIVDVGAYCQSYPNTKAQSASPGDDENKKKNCASSLLERLKSDGFALVRGTGISGQLCREALRVTHAFLQEADESVRRSSLSKRDRARRGYSPMNTENFASLIGTEGPNDLVRKFRMGPLLSSSPDASGEPPAGSTLLQENVWPSPTISADWNDASCNDFRCTLEAYYNSACLVANEILRAICDGLLSENPDLAVSLEPLSSSSITASRFDSTGDVDQNYNGLAHNTSILTLLGYRNGSRHKKMQQKKKKKVHPLVAAHTDVGLITMLIHDGGDCAVLQRQSTPSDSKCVDEETEFENVVVPSQINDDPVFVVNIADCLSALSRNRLPSTVHRVMPREGIVPRNCLALFVGLKGDQQLRIGSEDISYEAWRKKRIAESQSVLKGSKSQPI